MPVKVSRVPPACDPLVGLKTVLEGVEGAKQQRGGGAKELVLSSSWADSRRPLAAWFTASPLPSPTTTCTVYPPATSGGITHWSCVAVAVVTGQSMVALLVRASPECPTNVMVFSWAAERVDPPGPAPTPAVVARNLVPVTVNTDPVTRALPEKEVVVMVGVA